jgi:glutathione S-transferase
MKLYTADYAPNPRRVHWIMAEKGITGIAVEPVDLMALEHKIHARVNATGMAAIPVLELDDGTLIAESVAIGRYLESLYPEPNLFGRDPLETARIEMWFRRIEQHLATPLMHATRQTHPLLAVLEPPNPVVAEYLLGMANRFTAVLDRQLEGRDFIVADRLTIADIVAFCGLDFARIIRHRPDRDFANLGRWAKAMRERAPANRPS